MLDGLLRAAVPSVGGDERRIERLYVAESCWWTGFAGWNWRNGVESSEAWQIWGQWADRDRIHWQGDGAQCAETDIKTPIIGGESEKQQAQHDGADARAQ